MFTSSPQAVEVYEQGGWLPAAMLGWRHDDDGVCSARVRLEFAGVAEDAWVELTRLRLPESPPTRLGSTARPARSAPDPVETQQLPLVRDGGAPPTGREAVPRGGRRRAPETEEPAAAAPGLAVRAPGPVVPGRHRAPADAGRHRAADTGMLAAVSGGPRSPVRSRRPEAASAPAAVDAPPVPPLRSALPPAGPVVRVPADRDLHAERLTRPLRLEEGVGSARRPRRDSLNV